MSDAGLLPGHIKRQPPKGALAHVKIDKGEPHRVTCLHRKWLENRSTTATRRSWDHTGEKEKHHSCVWYEFPTKSPTFLLA